MLRFQAAAYTSQDFSWLQNGQVNWVSSASMFFFRASGFRLDFLRPILALVHKSETPRSIVTANFISSTKQLREEEKSSSACRPYFWQWSPVPQAQQQHLQEPTVQLQNLGNNFQHSIHWQVCLQLKLSNPTMTRWRMTQQPEQDWELPASHRVVCQGKPKFPQSLATWTKSSWSERYSRC